MLHRATLDDVIAYGSPRALGRSRRGERNRSGERGSGGGSAAAPSTPLTILGAKYVFWADDTTIVSSGNGTAITSWTDLFGGAHSLSVLTGAPVHRTTGFGPQNRGYAELTADSLGSTAAGLGDLLSANPCPAFSFVLVHRADALTVSRHMGGWASITGGTAGPYFTLWLRTPGISARWHRTNNTNAEYEPITGLTTLDSLERILIVSHAGNGLNLRIDEWTSIGGWTTRVDANFTNSASMVGITHFVVGGMGLGAAIATGVNPLAVSEIGVANAALTAGEFTALRAYLAA